MKTVITREAAKYLGISMRRVRALATSGTIWSRKAGPLNWVYDLDDLREYKTKRDKARAAGEVRGVAPQGVPVPAAKLVVSPEAPVLLTREAARYLGVSMRHLRLLARKKKLKTKKLGPASEAYYVEDLSRYKSEMAALRKAGKARGRKPGGFKPDPQPS